MLSSCSHHASIMRPSPSPLCAGAVLPADAGAGGDVPRVPGIGGGDGDPAGQPAGLWVHALTVLCSSCETRVQHAWSSPWPWGVV